MRRRTVTIAYAVAALAAAPPPAASAVEPVAAVRLLDCSRESRSAVFQGRMTHAPDAARMAMRFTLLVRTTAGAYERVKAPALGRWRRSLNGVGTLRVKQEVLGLSENAVYRARVDFRWYADDGQVVRSARRRSAACRQFGALPNLRAELLSAQPTGTAGVVRYGLRVWNAGKAPATSVGVRLAVDGAPIDDRVLAVLAPGEERVLSLLGPACERWAEAQIDPDEAIVESSEQDNAQRLGCGDLARR